MLQITKNDDELLKNYPFLQAIDKLESSHASEIWSILSDVPKEKISCVTCHDCYSARVYSKDKIDTTYYKEILIDFLLYELEKEARATFYSNAIRCYDAGLCDLHYENAAANTILLEKYNEYPDSKFTNSTVMYIRSSFEEWTYVELAFNIHIFEIKGRFGFQKLLNKTFPERKEIIHTVFTSTDIIPFVSSQVQNI
jgi:hypothetical protein